MVHFGEFLKTWRLRSNIVTRQVSFNRTKIGGKCQNKKLKCDILSNFQTMWTFKKGKTRIAFHKNPWLLSFFNLSEKKENGYLNCFVVCDVSDMTLGRIAVMAHNLIVICGFFYHHDFFNASFTSLSNLAQIRHFVAFFHTLTTKARLQIYKNN